MKKRDSPCSSINLRAFSRKDGAPSTSSRASKIGLPMTGNLTAGATKAKAEGKKLISKGWIKLGHRNKWNPKF